MTDEINFAIDNAEDYAIQTGNDDIIFHAENYYVRGNEIETDWPDGFPLDFNVITRLIFNDRDGNRVVYERVEEE